MHRLAICGAWLCACLVLRPFVAAAQEKNSMTDAAFSPRVVGEHRADFYSLETLLASPPFAGKTGEALALALYDYFTSTADGTWHGWPMNECEGEPVDWGDVSDPVKLLNAYGWLICGQNAGMLYGLYRAAGLPARCFSLPGHNLCEVHYDGRWHVLDVDMWTWFRTPEGHIASACELAQHARALIVENRKKSSPCNLPDRRLDGYAQMYDQAQASLKDGQLTTIFPHWATRAHTMDFVLRPGETLIRSQGHEGRFHMPQSWQEFMKGPSKDEWHGIPRERFEPFRTVGNGRWIYAPDLTARTRDVELGVWRRQGLAQDARGLVGPGSAVFRIQSPYPFCGLPDWQTTPYTCSNGVWLTLAGAGPVTAEVTDAEGHFVAVASTRGTFARKPDITPLLEARYDALIRVTLAAGARLDRLAFEGYLMTAPLSLPRLAEGQNRMELRVLDKFRKRTTPWTMPVDFRSEAALKTALVCLARGTLAPGSRNRLRVIPPADGPAQAVFRFDAPEMRRFAWAYVIATVPEGPTNAPAQQATLEWSTDGASWTPFASLAIPNTPLQWDASIDGEIVPPEGIQTVWIRVTSETGVIALDLAGHLGEPPSSGELRITHRWKEGGAEHVFEAPSGKAVYEVPCGRDPEVHTIEMRVPSVARQ